MSINHNNKTEEGIVLTKPKEEPKNLLFDAVSFATMQELSEISFISYDRGYKAVVEISYIGDEEAESDD